MAINKEKHIGARLSPELAARFDEVLANLGLSTSSAINLFAQAVVNYGGLPFEVNVNPMPLEERRELTRILKERLAIIERADPKDFVAHSEVEKLMGFSANEL